MSETPEPRRRVPYARRLQFMLLSKIKGTSHYGSSVYAIDGHPGLWQISKEDDLSAIRACTGRFNPNWLCRATEAEAEILEALKGEEK